MTKYQSIDPFTGIHHHQHHFIGHVELNQVLDNASSAFKIWRNLSFSDRAQCVLKLGELILNNKDRLAALAVSEMGKPIKEAEAEVLKCITACNYYANQAETLLQSTFSITDLGKHVEMRYEPIGTVLGVFPWNFPYWQIIRSAITVVMSGNTMIVKPAPCVPACSLALQGLFHEAGFAVGVVQTVFADEQQVADMIADQRIMACTLTGSEKAGSIVASHAARYIKPSVLELGGSDPFVVLDDADLIDAADKAITARFQNNGQSCIASKRFLLHENIANAFLDLLKTRVSQLVLGNPMNPEVNIGPMARKDLRDKLKQQVDDSVRAGAKIIYQHSKDMPTGFFFPPTILMDIPVESPAYSEELFGPVIAVMVLKDDEQIIEVANATNFGLGACVWTASKERAEKMASSITCGTVYINGVVKSHAHYPFGGAKHSGMGRELGPNGIRAFCNVKTIWT